MPSLSDDNLAAVLVYDSGGAVERVEWHSRANEPALLADCCQWRETALPLATPLAGYTAEHKITAGRTAA